MIESILKVVQGWVKIKGGTDGTFIGNVGDRLKTDHTVTVNTFNKDFFGNGVVSQIYNQIEVPLDDTNWTDYVTTTSVNGGSASQANGQVTFATGTNANGRYAAISVDAVKYRPNSEIGFGFTWCFPTPSIAGVTLRIGATDSITTWNNSVHFSHSGGTFSLVYNRGGSNIFNVQQSSWLDKCDGTSGSNYVDMNGNPVALDTTKDQLARVHCGLFGHAGFTVELLAPNQTWVTIYKYSNINSASVSIFSNFDLSIGAEVVKVAAGASSYTLSSACWGGWTGSPYQRANVVPTARSLLSFTKSVITGLSSSGGGTYVDVKVNPAGKLLTTTDLDDAAQNRVGFKEPLTDAFGRIRVAIPQNVYELVMYQDTVTAGEMTKTELNGGTVVYNNTITSMELNVTSTTNSETILQTKEYIRYKAGRSQLVKITGNLKGAVTNIDKEYGQFDDNNGFFFRTSDLIAYIVLRSNVTGSIVDTAVAQSSWNMDPLDGTGPSGITLDLSKQQIFVIDYQWQGSGAIRFGFSIPTTTDTTRIIYCHTIYNANDKTTPYSKTAILPIRARIKNRGTTAASMHITCLAVDTEGEDAPTGQLRTVNNGITSRTFTTAGSTIPLLSLRKKSTELAFPLQVLESNVFANSQDDFLITVQINGTLTGASWVANTGVGEFDVSATAITGGTIIYSNYLRGATAGQSLLSIEITKLTRDLNLGQTLAGVSDIVSIVATNITANANASAVINYRDLK